MANSVGSSDGTKSSTNAKASPIPAVICFSCDKPIEETSTSVTCKVCAAVYHEICANKFNLLPNGGISHCCSAVTKGDLKQFFRNFANEVKKDITSSLNKRIAKLEKKVNEQGAKLAENETKLASQSEKLSALNEFVNKFQLSPVDKNLPSADKEEIFTEIENRRLKSMNVIVYNFAVCPANLNDLTTINDILGEIENCPKAIYASRFGKSRDKNPKPLKISFNSKRDALIVLRLKNKLESDYGISVKNDLTPAQLNFRKDIYAELEKRLAEGEKDLKIHFYNGTPKIIVAKEKN